MSYLQRWMFDLRSALAAFALTLVVTVPLLVVSFGMVWFFTVAAILVVAAPQILIGTALTAIFRDYAFKWLVYLVAMLCNVGMFWNAIVGGPGYMAVLIPQLLVAFPVFYILIVWRQIARRGQD